jgi:hypothetical protein
MRKGWLVTAWVRRSGFCTLNMSDYVELLLYTIWHLPYKYTLLRWYEARLICH